MNRHLLLGSSVAAVLLVGGVLAADDLKSGPQTGQNILGAFHLLNVTGARAGQKNCLV
jgi:hypothetical protein